jgi:hypothetical protein
MVSEIFKFIFAENFLEKLIKFYEEKIYMKKISDMQKIELYDDYKKWKRSLRIVKALSLAYKLGNCI